MFKSDSVLENRCSRSYKKKQNLSPNIKYDGYEFMNYDYSIGIPII